MPEKDEPENPFFEFIKRLWLPVAGFIGAVLLIYQLVQIWKGDTQTVTWLVALAALIVWLIFLGWVSFSKPTSSRKPHRHSHEHLIEKRQGYHPFWQWTARIGLIITVATLIGGWFYKQYQQQVVTQQNQNKVIVVIAQFDGPEETYGLRNQILEQLNSSIQGEQDIKIIPINETVTIARGSEYARQLGKQYQADLVFWGWYRPTENPNLTLHIENLSPSKFPVLQESETYKPQATIADLQSFSLQQKIGQQTSALISFLSGLLYYQANKYDMAIAQFQQALDQPDWSNEMLNQGDAYFYLAYAYHIVGKYQEAIINYGNVIRINPQDAGAYNNRGGDFASQGQYVQAIADYTKSIQINPQDANTYVDRGVVYSDQKQDTQAVADYTQAIQINPQDANAYNNRGIAYGEQRQYIQAIADFNQAIQVNPQSADAYHNRGLAYQALGQQQAADADFAKYKELTGQSNPQPTPTP